MIERNLPGHRASTVEHCRKPVGLYEGRHLLVGVWSVVLVTIADGSDQLAHVVSVVRKYGTCQGAHEYAILGVRLIHHHSICGTSDGCQV